MLIVVVVVAMQSLYAVDACVSGQPSTDSSSLMPRGTPRERTGIGAGGDPTIDLGGRGHRPVGVEVHERVERRVEPIDALEVVLEDLDRLQVAAADCGGDRGGVELVNGWSSCCIVAVD